MAAHRARRASAHRRDLRALAAVDAFCTDLGEPIFASLAITDGVRKVWTASLVRPFGTKEA